MPTVTLSLRWLFPDGLHCSYVTDTGGQSEGGVICSYFRRRDGERSDENWTDVTRWEDYFKQGRMIYFQDELIHYRVIPVAASLAIY